MIDVDYIAFLQKHLTFLCVLNTFSTLLYGKSRTQLAGTNEIEKNTKICSLKALQFLSTNHDLV